VSKFSIDIFLKNFLDALNSVDQDYYRIETTYDPHGVVRERVFCYELYHQLRISLTNDYPYKIHGELDKHGHREIQRQNQKIPDFLFHIPGTHDENNVIVEVKGSLNRHLIISDLVKIKSFMANVNYKFGVFLLFSYTLENFLDEIKFSEIAINRTNRILFQENDLDEKIFIICTPRNRVYSIITFNDFKIRGLYENL